MAWCSAASLVASPGWTTSWTPGADTTGSQLVHMPQFCEPQQPRRRRSPDTLLVPDAGGKFFPVARRTESLFCPAHRWDRATDHLVLVILPRCLRGSQPLL